MSDTPRTDEYERSAAIEAIEYGKGWNPIDFARQLEREMAEELELLKEMYIFVAMRHKATDPWRNALDEWQKKVESLTGWNDYETIKDWMENK